MTSNHPNDGHVTSSFGFGTRAIHAGQPPNKETGAVIIPISLSTTFAQESPGVHKGYDYSRSGNPTREAFEECLASLEHAQYGLAFASGLACTTTITHMLKAGDNVICIDDVYGGTSRYFRRIAAPFDLKFSFVDFHKPGALEATFTPTTKLVWIETPTNPTLKLVDIAAVAQIVHRHNAILVVDNTFMSPYSQNPLDLGADIVMHSVTKYINGHSDVVMGALATNSKELFDRLKFLQNGIGAIPSPFDCFLALRGVKTLHVRMREHERNALVVAQFLEKHPKVERVLYPGLPSHPQHDLALKQMRCFGGMITFFIRGGFNEAKKFLEGCKIIALAESLGGVESLIEHPASMTHLSIPAEVRATLGISDTLIRLSVGIEDVSDLVTELKACLDSVPAV
mmetsp:Transcript_11810/g.20112  ORF Transcript_11810/g.20112 Transcript_11810/m.20112 type:complete len:398 (+) Transcript_11810:94-1287(+)|eukprot:CAMPEP_0184657876 /NCGR_PEP_ID=MMETSP0308-20130426/22347_1 /TAXON_ID=38269 /ORGANISM="Gloeochaete witrockiana, Strain SAG 46.84" /LENGTH=397 /DNA_ID=CAMNT_0027096265 /DNA_START=53 /DNA_END=1246 /DNA_ORIENTATION=+